MSLADTVRDLEAEVQAEAAARFCARERLRREPETTQTELERFAALVYQLVWKATHSSTLLRH